MTSLKQQLITIRRRIHQYPELGNQEYRTADYISRILQANGIFTRRVSKTGVVGILSRTVLPKNACIALRTELDALPIQEQTQKSYSSKRKGIMHACGHDANIAIVLGAAILLCKEKFNGSVKFIFQPNEESGGGAKQMIASGVLNKPSVEAIIGVHVNPLLKANTAGFKYGEMMAAVDRFVIKLFGGGGHVAFPHKGKDMVLISTEIVNYLQSLLTHQIDPIEPAIVTIGRISAGTRFNVLADSAELEGTVRTLNEYWHKRIPKLIKKLLEYIVRKYKIVYNFEYEILGSTLRNDTGLVELCRVTAERLLGKKNVVLLEKPCMGGEDFAEYIRYIPGCLFYFGCGKNFPWHHPKFDIDENILVTAAELLKEIVLSYLTKKN